MLQQAGLTKACVFLKGLESSPTLVIAAYVDGLILAGKKQTIEEFKLRLSSRFEFQSAGELRWYLGIAVSRDRAKGTITLSQRKYIEDTLKEFKLTNINSSATPGDVNMSLTSPAEPIDPSLLKRLEQRTPYRKAVGMLHHAARGARPDIAFITGQRALPSINPPPLTTTLSSEYLGIYKDPRISVLPTARAQDIATPLQPLATLAGQPVQRQGSRPQDM
jgi:hypothetical protein